MVLEISVIIPVHNAAKFIEKAVKSALSQPETREILLIEDGSTDESLKVCEELSKKHERIRLLRHPNGDNRGPGSSRNLGLKTARFEYIAFLDADDFYLENRFEHTAKSFRQHKSAVGIYEAVERIFNDDESKAEFILKKGKDFMLNSAKLIAPSELFEEFFLAGRTIISLDGLVIKKEVIPVVGYFDEDLRLGQDTDWLLRLSLAGDLYPGRQDRPVTLSLVHGANNTLSTNRVLAMRWRFYGKWLRRIIKMNFSKRLNRKIVNCYLYYHPLLKNWKEKRVMRLTFKFFCGVFLLIKYPELIKKLI